MEKQHATPKDGRNNRMAERVGVSVLPEAGDTAWDLPNLTPLVRLSAKEQFLDMQARPGDIWHVRSQLLGAQRESWARRISLQNGNACLQQAMVERPSDEFEGYQRRLLVLIAAGDRREIWKFVASIQQTPISEAEQWQLYDIATDGVAQILNEDLLAACQTDDKEAILNIFETPDLFQVPEEQQRKLRHLLSEGLYRIQRRELTAAEESGDKEAVLRIMETTMVGIVQDDEGKQLEARCTKAMGVMYKRQLVEAIQNQDRNGILKAFEGVIVGLVSDKDADDMKKLAVEGLRKLGENELADLIEKRPDVTEITRIIRPDLKSIPKLEDFEKETDEWIRNNFPQLYAPEASGEPERKEKPTRGRKRQTGETSRVALPKRISAPEVEILQDDRGKVVILVDSVPVIQGRFKAPLAGVAAKFDVPKWDPEKQYLFLNVHVAMGVRLEYVPGFRNALRKNGVDLLVHLHNHPAPEQEGTIVLIERAPSS